LAPARGGREDEIVGKIAGQNRVHFSFERSERGGFRARGLDVPLTVTATTFGALRSKASAQVRALFGGDRTVSFLIGVPRAAPSAAALPPPGEEDTIPTGANHGAQAPAHAETLSVPQKA
jgi:hypothetical protein